MWITATKTSKLIKPRRLPVTVNLSIFSLKKSCTSSFEIANCKPLSRYAFQQIDQYAELKFSNISKQEVLIVGPDFIKIKSYKKAGIYALEFTVISVVT